MGRATLQLSALALTLAFAVPVIAEGRTTNEQLPPEFAWLTVALDKPKECEAGLNEIIVNLEQYERSGWRNSARAARKAAQRIQKILRNAYLTNDACYPALAAGYAAGATQIVFSNSGTYFAAAKVVVELFNLGNLIALTPSLRESLGGVWKKEILGAYECGASRIYFDPSQAPMNLGGTLLHELDHLTRDKLVGSPKVRDPEQSVLLDESFAAMVAAFYQIRITKSIYRMSRLQIDGLFGGRNVEPFTLQSDNTLYSRQGFLAQLSNLTGTVYDRSFAQFWNLLNLQTEAVDRPLREIFEHVSHVYFPGIPVDGGAVLEIAMGLDPNYTAFERRLDELLPSFVPEASIQGYLRSRLSWPSSSCLKFEDEIKKGALKNYVGGPAGTNTGNEGVRPGNEGVRPGITVQPCLKFSSEF